MRLTKAQKSLIAGFIAAGIGFIFCVVSGFLEQDLLCNIFKVDPNDTYMFSAASAEIIFSFTIQFVFLGFIIIGAFIFSCLKREVRKTASIIVLVIYILVIIGYHYLSLRVAGGNVNYMAKFGMIDDMLKIFTLSAQAGLLYGLARMRYEDTE